MPKFQNVITYELKMKNILYFLYGGMPRQTPDDSIHAEFYPLLTTGTGCKFDSMDTDFIRAHFSSLAPNIPANDTNLLYDLYGRADNKYHGSGSSASQDFARSITSEKVHEMMLANKAILRQWDLSNFQAGMADYLDHIAEAEKDITGRYAFNAGCLFHLIEKLKAALYESVSDTDQQTEQYAYILTWLLIASITRGNLSDNLLKCFMIPPVLEDHSGMQEQNNQYEKAEKTKEQKTARLARWYQYIYPRSQNMYCTRPQLNALIEKEFSSQRCVFLVGITGCGKTEAARYYAHCLQENGVVKHAIPIKLHEDGSGTYQDLLKQIETIDTTNFPEELITSEDLIILDNYNDMSNPVIFTLLERFPETRIIVTAQDNSPIFQNIGSTIELEKEAEKNTDEKNAFAVNLFCKYAGIASLTDEDIECIRIIASQVYYHALTMQLLGIHYRMGEWHLKHYAEMIQKSVSNTIKIGLQVAVNKDEKVMFGTPYTILKNLVTDGIILQKITEMERQVLGTTVLLAPLTSNAGLICELTGDYDYPDQKDCRAKDAIRSLERKGILHLDNDQNIYLHPIVETIILDKKVCNKDGKALAETSPAFLLHLTKNKLVERYSDNHPEIFHNVEEVKKNEYTNWCSSYIEKHIIPYVSNENEKLQEKFATEPYLYVYCTGAQGDAVYAKFLSGEEYCLLDAGMHKCCNFRYFTDKEDPHSSSFLACHILGCNQNHLESLSVPQYVAGCEVQDIRRFAFQNFKYLKHVSLPSSLQYISEFAFCNCVSLENMAFPDSLESIGVRAFYNCHNLKQIFWGFNSHLKRIEQGAFSLCRKLAERLQLPDNLEAINRYAFSECGALTEIIIPDNTFEIGAYTFQDCDHVEFIYMGKSMTYIPKGCFYKCRALKTLQIPGNIKTVGEESFSDCTSLQKVIIENGVEKIEDRVFAYCKNLQKVSLPDSIVDLEKTPFLGSPNVVVYVSEGSLADHLLQFHSLNNRAYVTICYNN